MARDGIDYRERYETVVRALGFDPERIGSVDHAEVLEQASALKRITDGIPETCADLLRAILEQAAVSGARVVLRDMVSSASRRAEEMASANREHSGSPLTQLFGNRVPNGTDGSIPALDRIFEIMASTDAARASEPGGDSVMDRIAALANSGDGEAVLALVDAARKLPGGEWWLDDNRPWRLMLNLSAVAEDEELFPEYDSVAVMALFDHDNHTRGTVGDGEPAHLKAILRVLTAAAALQRPADGRNAPIPEPASRETK